MESKKITVSIAAYKVEKYIEKTLLSVLAQDYPNIEIIVVDDCGGDNTVDIVRGIQSTHQRGNIIRLISHPHNIGTGAARNTGIDEAKGEYIFFLDGDDYIEKNTLSKLYSIITRTNDDLVVSSHRIVDEEGTELDKIIYSENQVRGEYAAAKWIQSCKQKFPPYLWNKIYKLSFLKENNIRATSHHRNEDPWFTFQAMFAAKSITFISDITLNYVMRPGSTIHQDLSEFYYRQYMEMYDSMSSLLDNKLKNGYDVPIEYFEYFGWRCFGHLNSVLHSTFSKKEKLVYYSHIKQLAKTNIKSKHFGLTYYKINYYLLYKCNSIIMYKLVNRIMSLLMKFRILKRP